MYIQDQKVPWGIFIFSQSKNSEIDWCLMNKLDIRIKLEKLRIELVQPCLSYYLVGDWKLLNTFLISVFVWCMTETLANIYLYIHSFE